MNDFEENVFVFLNEMVASSQKKLKFQLQIFTYFSQKQVLIRSAGRFFIKSFHSFHLTYVL